MPDAHHQAGVAAATAAGGPAGGRGERQRPRAAGQTHQRHPSAYGRAAGVRVHVGQLHHAADEDAGAGGRYRSAHRAAFCFMEALGLCGSLAYAQLRCPVGGTGAECPSHSFFVFVFKSLVPSSNVTFRHLFFVLKK